MDWIFRKSQIFRLDISMKMFSAQDRQRKLNYTNPLIREPMFTIRFAQLLTNLLHWEMDVAKVRVALSSFRCVMTSSANVFHIYVAQIEVVITS